ncbi:Uncharacterised protein [Mycobacteroides abscessus subsp. abscessus]|nr:Uncharacterised protein [Mycobacteroides abscessus subsp. abscessus]SKR67760.1 Uncharacterised protein [Mycobacteroides abscessus subsp. abscessus]SKR72248.1 Uncharacterised protein [Mycobacteroides abscessus subsp. abscessus]SKT27186.1 Uncharacterised protein [Mycobacteroides abscessus subsp. abscessus]
MDFNTPLQSLHGWPAAAVLIAIVVAIAAVLIVGICQ